MTEFLNYIARSGLYLGIFYAFYLLVMRRTTFFRLNRLVLLIGSAVCALLPLLRIRTVHFPVASGPIAVTAAGATETAAVAGSISWTGLLSVLYFAGIVAVAGFTLYSVLELLRQTSGCTRLRKEGIKTVLLHEGQPSFTFGGTIYICRKDLEENPAIFSHELVHVRRRHCLDLFLFRIVQIVWWWNPLVWIMRTELGLLHEYEADEGVLNQGIDATQYQLLLVRKAVGEQRFSLASGFQHAQLKNRINMMLKTPTSGWKSLSWLLILPFLAGTMFLCNPVRARVVAEPTESISETAQAALPDTTKVVPFDQVETKPTFQGGDAGKFSLWVKENLRFPQTAKDAGAQGRVLVQFAICPDGKVRDVKVLRGVHPDLDAEVVRVISSSPDWKAGSVKGEPVKTTFIFPVIFSQNGKNDPKPKNE